MYNVYQRINNTQLKRSRFFTQKVVQAWGSWLLLMSKWTLLYLAMGQNILKCLVSSAYNIPKSLNVFLKTCNIWVILPEFGALLMQFLVSVEICWHFWLFHMLPKGKSSTCIETGHWPYLFWTLPLLTYYILQSTCLCMLYNISKKDGLGVSKEFLYL